MPKQQRHRHSARRAASQAMRSPVQQRAVVGWRYWLAGACCALLSVFLLWHLAGIQVLPSKERGYKFLQNQGQARSLRTETINANRGVITDRNGEPLAVSSPVVSIAGNPRILIDLPEQWPVLAKAVGMSSQDFAALVKRYASREFVYLRRHLPPAQAQDILDQNLPGIFSLQEYQRFYPAGEVAAHLVGFTNIDDLGQEGIELAYENWLRGTAGAKQVMKDRRGRTIEEVRLINSARPGKDLALSIDLRLQYMAYRALKEAATRHNAVGGSAVIIDVATGEVLAMVNQPSFNPNNRRNLSPAAVRNRAMTDLFEPGSAVKPLSVLAALESGKYGPHTAIDTSPGHIRVPGMIFYDPGNYGLLDVTGVITKSSNVGTTKIVMDLDPNDVHALFFRMGLGQTTGSGFPGEAAGDLPNRMPWSAVERANFAFGYGLQVTTVQLAAAFAIIANDGVKQPVSLLRKTIEPGQAVLNRRHARQVLAMMETVTEPGGTGTRARLASYTAAGKTGTARKVVGGEYSFEAAYSVFAGMAPAQNPRIAVAVMIDEARAGESGGGRVAAPIFADIAEGALRILQVPPDKGPVRFSDATAGGRPLS